MVKNLSKTLKGDSARSIRRVSLVAFLSGLVILYGLSLFYNQISGVLLPFFIAFILAYIFNKPVSFLSERVKLGRSLSTSLIVFSFLFLIVFGGSLALPYIQKEVLTFAKKVPQLATKLNGLLSPMVDTVLSQLDADQVTQFKSQLSQYLGGAVSWIVGVMVKILTSGVALANAVTLTIITPIIMFYLLKDFPEITKTVIGWVPKRYKKTFKSNLRQIDHKLSSYGKGQGMMCLLLSILYAFCLWLIGLDQALFIGVLSGLLSFIPFLGMLIGLAVALAATISQFAEWWPVANVLIIYGVLTIIENNVLAPRLIGEKIGVPPAWVIFSLLAGGALIGFMGFLLAFPATAALSVIVKSTIKYYKKTDFYLRSA